MLLTSGTIFGSSVVKVPIGNEGNINPSYFDDYIIIAKQRNKNNNKDNNRSFLGVLPIITVAAILLTLPVSIAAIIIAGKPIIVIIIGRVALLVRISNKAE